MKIETFLTIVTVIVFFILYWMIILNDEKHPDHYPERVYAPTLQP
jgi:hypothetical protein